MLHSMMFAPFRNSFVERVCPRNRTECCHISAPEAANRLPVQINFADGNQFYFALLARCALALCVKSTDALQRVSEHVQPKR